MFCEYQIHSRNDQSKNSFLLEWSFLQLRSLNRDQVSDWLPSTHTTIFTIHHPYNANTSFATCSTSEIHLHYLLTFRNYTVTFVTIKSTAIREKTLVQLLLSTCVTLKSNCLQSAKKCFFSMIRINVFDIPLRRFRLTCGLRERAGTAGSNPTDSMNVRLLCLWFIVKVAASATSRALVRGSSFGGGS